MVTGKGTMQQLCWSKEHNSR